MSDLAALIRNRNTLAARAREANSSLQRAERAITRWGKEQVESALAGKGITPGKSIVRMKIRARRAGRILIEPATVLLDHVGRVDPPTMARDDLGPNACSTDMWWVAHLYWRSVRKDGLPGAKHDFCVIQGDTAEEIATVIEHVRDLE